MNFLIIPDSFKNCLSAPEVGKYISKGIKAVFTNANVKVIPVADGGEGTVQAIISSVGGTMKKVMVHDPLMRPIESYFGIMPDNKTAIIEMAAASGIELITDKERDPLKTTTYGTGELIKEALNAGCTDIIIGIGGSATNDGGVGLAMALGTKFITSKGELFEYGGESLIALTDIIISGIDERLANTNIMVACDVKNTICGNKGASAVFSPQKGATKEMVVELDAGLANLAKLVKNKLGKDIEHIEGGGAAGGLGAGLVAFTGANLVGGFSLIANLLNLDEEIRTADIVITAEGAIDFQTMYGKTPAGVAKIANKHKKPVFVFAGSALEDASKIDKSIITSIIPITRRPVELSEALKMAPKWLTQSAIEFCLTIKTGINLT